MSFTDRDTDPMAMLRRAGGEEDVPAETRARVWSAVTGTLQASGMALSAASSHFAAREIADQAASAAPGGHAALTTTGDGLASWVSQFMRWSAPALVVGAAAGVTAKGVLAPTEKPPVHRAAVKEVAEPIPAAPPVGSTEGVMPPVAATSERTELPRAAAAPSSESSANAKPGSAARELARERALLDQARAQIAAGEPARALEFVERHERRHQQGALTEEREALAVNALVSLRRYREAAQRGEAFRVRYPKSLLMPSVEAALGAIPE
jgi:hypothetical protein